jgi:hypothetical protein
MSDFTVDDEIRMMEIELALLKKKRERAMTEQSNAGTSSNAPAKPRTSLNSADGDRGSSGGGLLLLEVQPRSFNCGRKAEGKGHVCERTKEGLEENEQEVQQDGTPGSLDNVQGHQRALEEGLPKCVPGLSAGGHHLAHTGCRLRVRSWLEKKDSDVAI